MTVYSARDIETDLNGDILLSKVGDVNLADSLVTYKSAANFILRTDYGDYAPDSSVGANLGSFVGEKNTRRTAELMERNIITALRTRIFSAPDIDATVVPFDIEEVLCVVTIAGLFLIDGVLKSVDEERIAYSFPYIEGSFITPITI